MKPHLQVLVFGIATMSCVFGWRGEADLVGDHDLQGVATVRIDLPSTPLVVDTCEPLAPGTCPERLRYAGRILATGGSASDARAHAEKPALVFERDGALARLRADVPLAVRGLIEFEIGAVELPADRNFEFHTDLGDVDVHGVRGAVTIEVGRGDVAVHGGDAGVAVAVDVGEIDVTSGGDVDLSTGAGHVTLVQDGAPRRVFIDARGDVELELAASSDLDLEIRADGSISVQTTTVVALADHRLVRRVGAGTIRVEIHAGGNVTVTERP